MSQIWTCSFKQCGKASQKKWGKKTKKTKILPRVPSLALGEGSLFPECPVLALGKGPLPGEDFFLSFNGVGGVDRQVTCFFVECWSSPSVALGEEGICRVLLFTECQDLCGTRESLSSPSAILPRVQHSGKILFPECPIFCTRGSQRHSENFVSPVVCIVLLQLYIALFYNT